MIKRLTSKEKSLIPAYKLVLNKDAEADLKVIYDYITEHDCSENANYVLDGLLKIIENLNHFPKKAVSLKSYKV